MSLSDVTIRSIEFVDARDPDGRPVRVGIGTTEGNSVVLIVDIPSLRADGAPPLATAVVAAGQMPQVQKLMREALRDVTTGRPDER